MPRPITPLQVARMRLVAQCLVGRRLHSPQDVVAHLTCIQSQDWSGCRLAIAARTMSRSLEQVDAAYNHGSIVRSWPMRGTLHTVLAGDLGWMLDVTKGRIRAQYSSRLRALGIDDAVRESALGVTVEALSGGLALSRRALLDRWSLAGLDVSGQRGAHLLIDLSVDAVICLGPISSGVQQFVLCDDWLPTPERHGNPMTTWGRRYFASHGPATRKDFQRWGGFLVRETDPVWEAIIEDFEQFELEGSRYFAPSSVVEAGASRRTLTPLLTAAFDEILLGYADRSATLPPEFADLVTPGGNGMFKAVVIDGGRAVGTWSRAYGPQDPPSVALFTSSPSRRLARARLRMPAT